MKKGFFFSFLLFITTFSYGQHFNVGGILGVNASQISGDNYSGFNKAGLLAGIYTNLDLPSGINLQFEINYSEKGSRKNPQTDIGDNDFFLLRLNYIEVPVMVRWRKNRFVFEGGAYYGRLIDQYMEDENGPFEIDPNYKQFRKYDVGGLVGISFHFTDNVIMNWRFNNSILPVRDFDSGSSYLFNFGMYHSYFSFSMRYEFIGNHE